MSQLRTTLGHFRLKSAVRRYGNLSSGNSINQRQGASSSLLQWPFRIPVTSSSSLLFLPSHICSSCQILYLAVVVMALEPRATHPPTKIQTFTQVYTLTPLCMAKEPVGVLAMPWIFSTHISSSLHHYFTEKPVGVYISYLDDLSSCKSLDKTTHHYLVDLLPRTYSYMSPLA